MGIVGVMDITFVYFEGKSEIQKSNESEVMFAKFVCYDSFSCVYLCVLLLKEIL